jgi:DNA-binding CsgD family transcriptional regulator
VVDGERYEPAAGDEPDESDDLFWRGFWECLACSYPQRTGDYQTVTRLSDVYARRDFEHTTMAAYFAQQGFRHEVLVPLPPDGVLDRRLLFFRRTGRDFSDRDVATLALLRPHIFALHLRQRRRNQGEPELTSRQRQILRMVAAGCTNVQVARALFVSEATVGKHLENIYARLDVTNRTAAAATITALDRPA